MFPTAPVQPSNAAWSDFASIGQGGISPCIPVAFLKQELNSQHPDGHFGNLPYTPGQLQKHWATSLMFRPHFGIGPRRFVHPSYVADASSIVSVQGGNAPVTSLQN